MASNEPATEDRHTLRLVADSPAGAVFRPVSGETTHVTVFATRYCSRSARRTVSVECGRGKTRKKPLDRVAGGSIIAGLPCIERRACSLTSEQVCRREDARVVAAASLTGRCYSKPVVVVFDQPLGVKMLVFARHRRLSFSSTQE